MGLVLPARMVGALIDPVVFSEDFRAEFGNGGIVFHQFGAGVDVIVIVVVFAVGAEP